MTEFDPSSFHRLYFVDLLLNFLKLGAFSSIDIPSFLIDHVLVKLLFDHVLLELLGSSHTSVQLTAPSALSLLRVLTPHLSPCDVVDHEVLLWYFIRNVKQTVFIDLLCLSQPLLPEFSFLVLFAEEHIQAKTNALIRVERQVNVLILKDLVSSRC